jgi:hypothetical protein
VAHPATICLNTLVRCLHACTGLVVAALLPVAAGLSFAQETAERTKSEHFLPKTTRAWVSIGSLTDLEVALYETKMGHLAQDPDLAPVVESFSTQITDWLDNRNVKFALNMESLGKLNSGEICFAAILDRQEGQSDAASHAIVVMVDIQGHEADYNRMMAEVQTDLTQRGAKSFELSILDQTVTRWEFEKPRGIAVRENVFFARVDDRLIACDDLTILGELIAAILQPAAADSVLAKHEPFAKIRQRCLQGEAEWQPQIRWFFEPFGYVELTDLLAQRNRSSRLDPNAREPREIAAILQRQGFNVTEGLGGDFMFAHQGTEMLHRFFVYAPGNTSGEGPRFEKAARMLDFSNPGD